MRQYDKVKIIKKAKEDNTRCPPNTTDQWHPCRYCGGLHALGQYLVYSKTCVGCGKTGHFKKVCQSRRDRAVNDLEIERAQEGNEGEIEAVSINSVHLNKTWSLLMAKLEMQSGRNTIVIPYKIDMGSEGNIMPLFIFKKLFKNVTEEQLWKSIKGHIWLRTHSKTNITQLGMCVVVFKFKNIKKRCVFFVVPGNGQALLGMSDTAALQLINVNIDFIQAEVAECKTNIEQEIYMVEKSCANTDAESQTKQGTNGQNGQN